MFKAINYLRDNLVTPVNQFVATHLTELKLGYLVLGSLFIVIGATAPSPTCLGLGITIDVITVLLLIKAGVKYYAQKSAKERMDAESGQRPTAEYVPTEKNWGAKVVGDGVKIASSDVCNGDPACRGSTTFGDYNTRQNRGIRDDDL